MRCPNRIPNRIKTPAGFIAALGLSACATVGPNFVPPAPPAVTGYLMAGDLVSSVTMLNPESRRAGPWWEALGSADLNAVMMAALRGNQTLATAEATLEQTRVEAERARVAARSPSVTVNAAASRDRINTSAFGFGGFPSPTINLFSVGAATSYDLDLAGGARRRIEAAGAAQAAQGYRTDAAYLTLTGNVALAAVKIAGLREQLAALQTLEADDQAMIDIDRRADAAGGVSTASGVADRAQLAQDQALTPVVTQNLALARHALALLAGKTPSQWAPPDFAFAQFTPPAVVPLDLPSAWVRNRPDILAAEADLHADTARIGVATADFYPDVKLTASFTQMALKPSTFLDYGSSGWNFGPTLTMPILSARTRRVHLAAAQTQARLSMARYRQTVLTAFAQVADVLTAIGHDDERLVADRRYETAAQTGLRDAQTAFDLGGGPRQAVVQARRRLDRAGLARIESQGRRLMDVVELYAVTSAADRPSTVDHPIAATRAGGH